MGRGSFTQEQAERVSGQRGFRDHYALELDHHSIVKEVKALYPAWMEGLKVWLLFAPFLIFILAVLYADLGVEGWWYASGFFVMPFISTFIRRKTAHITLFILTSALMALWILVMPEFLLTLLGAIFCFLLAVYGIIRKNGREERPLTTVYLLFVILILTVTNLVMISRDMSGYQPLVFLQGLVYTGLFLFLRHRISLIDSLSEIDQKANRSVREMTRFNLWLFVGFFLLVVLLFLSLYEIRLGNMLSLIANYGLLWGRRLIRLILRIQPTEKALAQETEIIHRTSLDLMDLLGGGETAAFWIVTERILVFVAIIGAAFFVLNFIYQIYRRFGHREVYLENDREVSREFYTNGLSRMKRGDKHSVPEDPVRKRYYDLVKDEMGENVLPSDTPTAVATKVPEVEKILYDYEKVRYRWHKGNEEKSS